MAANDYMFVPTDLALGWRVARLAKIQGQAQAYDEGYLDGYATACALLASYDADLREIVRAGIKKSDLDKIYKRDADILKEFFEEYNAS